MKNERFHLVMRYSYWNELCPLDENPSASRRVFYCLNPPKIILKLRFTSHFRLFETFLS